MAKISYGLDVRPLTPNSTYLHSRCRHFDTLYLGRYAVYIGITCRNSARRRWSLALAQRVDFCHVKHGHSTGILCGAFLTRILDFGSSTKHPRPHSVPYLLALTSKKGRRYLTCSHSSVPSAWQMEGQLEPGTP